MKILFVYPSNLTYGSYKFKSNLLGKILISYNSPPYLDFQMLRITTPEKHTIEYISEDFNKIDYEKEFDLVGISCGTLNANRAYEIADEFKNRDTKVVLGGWHPSILPNEALQHADSVVVGEAEETWPILLNDLENKKLKTIYRQEKPVDLSKLPIRKGDFIKRHGFLGFVQTSRGCPNKCKFCCITNTEHWRVYRKRPIDDVICEIKETPQKFIHLADSSSTLDINYTKELFKKMKDLNKKFSCNANFSILRKDEELIKLARDAGCLHFQCGFESIHEKNLNEFCTKKKKEKDNAKTIKRIHDNGIEIYGNFVFGFDYDTKSIFNDTLDEINDWGLNLANFSILTPFPGTPLYETLKKEGRILNENWSNYDLHHVVFKPKNMTPEELLHGTEQAYRDYFSVSNSIERLKRSFSVGFYPFIFLSTTNFFLFRSTKKYKEFQ